MSANSIGANQAYLANRSAVHPKLKDLRSAVEKEIPRMEKSFHGGQILAQF